MKRSIINLLFANCMLFYALHAQDEITTSSNPGAIDVVSGTGVLGEKLGFSKNSGIRLGALLIPNHDFDNVLKPLPVADKNLAISATTGLIYTPIYVNSMLLGVLPGYYNSAYGVALKYAPSDNLYVHYGLYDGNLARGKQTGLQGPTFNAYRFQIAELGYAWG